MATAVPAVAWADTAELASNLSLVCTSVAAAVPSSSKRQPSSTSLQQPVPPISAGRNCEVGAGRAGRK